MHQACSRRRGRYLIFGVVIVAFVAVSCATGSSSSVAANKQPALRASSTGERTLDSGADTPPSPTAEHIAAEDIARLYRASERVIQACFSVTTDDGMTDPITVEVALVFSAEGRVTSVRVEAGKRPHLVDCLGQVLRSWHVRPLGVDRVTLEFPITFRP